MILEIMNMRNLQ